MVGEFFKKIRGGLETMEREVVEEIQRGKIER